MNDSDYVVAFNIIDNPDRQWSWPGCEVLVAFSILTVILIFWMIEDQKLGKIAFFKLKVSFAVFGIALMMLIVLPVSVIATYSDYQKCSQTFASGQASYVEGTVEDFVPMPYSGHALESFTVSGVPFSYSDYIPKAGFNQTSSHGGPIHQGLPVKIWYVGNEIVKLEIKK